jgi:SAM-dependent methyltransferase
MTAETTAAATRAQLHGMWSAVAGSWREHADYVDRRAAPVTRELLRRAAPQPGERVLELACGPGGVGLEAAALVQPDGEIVLSDVAPEMTAIAAARAAERGVANVRTCELDLEQIAQPDESFDVVLCREGLMFATDPARATCEIARVLRPGGRVAIAVWGPRERNPWLGVCLTAVSEQLGQPVPPPGVPGPFSLDDAGHLGDLMTAAGLADVVVDELEVPMRATTFDEWRTRTSALAGPLARRLESLPEPAARALRGRLEEAVRPYETSAGLEFGGVTLIASGRRAAP